MLSDVVPAREEGAAAPRSGAPPRVLRRRKLLAPPTRDSSAQTPGPPTTHGGRGTGPLARSSTLFARRSSPLMPTTASPGPFGWPRPGSTCTPIRREISGRSTLRPGLTPSVTLMPDPADATHVARVDFSPGQPGAFPLYAAIPKRRTNRGPYDTARAVAAQTLAAMAALIDEPDVGSSGSQATRTRRLSPT